MKRIIPTLLIAGISVALLSCQGKGKPRFVNDYEIYTDTIRSHVYMHTMKGGLLHAPDCPCFTDTIFNK